MTEDRTCGTCAHLGQLILKSVWGEWADDYLCRKRDERRKALAVRRPDMDFLDHWRTPMDVQRRFPACPLYEALAASPAPEAADGT